MEKIIGDWNTEVRLSGDEAKEICKLTQGEACCAFLVCDRNGFSCLKYDYPNNISLYRRLETGEINAKGTGEWKGCAWESEAK